MVVAAAGCRLPPPKPVVVYVPTSVIIDPDAPFGRSKVASVAKNFWQAMSLLDTGYVTKHVVTDDQRAFSRAMSLVMTGQHDEAELALDSIRVSASDSLVRVTSRVLMTAILQYRDKWKILAELTSGTKQDNAFLDDVNKADVESWASAFKNVKERQITFAAKPVTLPLILSASGTPMVAVLVNGKPKTMWLDTGSSMSILSSNVAVECGVVPIVPDTLEVATTTGHVPARPTAIDRIDIGGIHILNSTAMIVSSDLMQVRIGDTETPVTSIGIDGVIGFDIISRFDLRIDYVHKLVTFIKPAPLRGRAASLSRNLFWVGSPIVRLVSDKGVPLHFNLDTGAQETYSTDALVDKTRTRTFAGERRLVGGLAGLQVVHGKFIDEVRMSMGGQRLLFRKMLVYAPAVATFVPLDGVLGSDVGKSGTVRIDATNGLFLLEGERYDPGLQIKS
jgi:Predicted aspartyl protease